MIRTLHTDIVEHFQAVLAMHTGSATVPMPSIGAWLSYGLGTLNPEPAVVRVPRASTCPTPARRSGTATSCRRFIRACGSCRATSRSPILSLAARSVTLHELEQRMLRDVNELHAAARPRDSNLAARISSFDIARGMMRAAPEVVRPARANRPRRWPPTAWREGDRKSFALRSA